MAVDRLIGIDFGTSTSVIRIKRYENMKPLGEKLDTKEVIFGGMSNMVPTVIMKSKTNPDAVYYGYDALKGRKNMEQFHSFKVDLESRDPEKMERARALTEEFFRFMAKTYRQQSDDGHLGDADDQEHTIISYPVKWSQETKRFMINAAEKAGFPDVRGLDEAQAAIHAVTIQSTNYLVNRRLLTKGVPATILLIDMGAGTTDLVLCRYTFDDEHKNEILSTWPKDGRILFGGKEIDILLQDFFRDKMDADDARLVFKRVGADKFKAWKETIVSPAMMRNDTVSEFEALDQCVEMAEIDMDDYSLNRKALENCLSGYLPQLPRLIDGCLKDAAVKGDAVDLVIVTGGHSQWYFIQEMLSGRMDRFGKVDLPKVKADPSRIVPISRPQETVALGLAYAFMQAEIIPDTPIPDPPVPETVPPKPVPPTSVPTKLVPPTPVLPKPADDLEYTPESEFELLAYGEGYMISKYLGDQKVVVIPPEIRGRKVLRIGNEAFVRRGRFLLGSWDESSIEKVVIPNTISIIGDRAFWGCEKLHTVIAHDGIISIGDYAFTGCTSLSRLDFGMGDVPLKFVRFPKKLEKLGSLAISDANGKCLFKEVMLSKSTKWRTRLFGQSENAFSESSCAVFYYND